MDYKVFYDWVSGVQCSRSNPFNSCLCPSPKVSLLHLRTTPIFASRKGAFCNFWPQSHFFYMKRTDVELPGSSYVSSCFNMLTKFMS